MRSIRSRLRQGVVMILALVFVIQLAMVTYAIRHLTEEYVLIRLEQDARSLLAAVEIDADGRPRVPMRHLVDVYQHPFSGHYFHIESEGRDFHSRSLWDTDLTIGGVGVGGSRAEHIDGPLDQSLLAYVASFRKQGRIYNIAVAQDVGDLNSDIVQLQMAYGGISLLALVLLSYLQVYILRWGMRPIERARLQLNAMEQGELIRLDEEAPEEVLPLVREINRLLDLLSQRMQRSRNAMGNLAHALKTPLSVIARLAAVSQDNETPDKQEQLREQVERMRALIDRELKRARLAAGGKSVSRFNPEADIAALISVMKQLYVDKGLRYETEIKVDGAVQLDREDMLETVGNLLDNASKWARSIVTVKVFSHDGLHIAVADDGPGVSPEIRDELKKRGVRIDESTAGHGLGLAIVHDTVTHYQGEMRLGASATLGGLEVELIFPV